MFFLGAVLKDFEGNWIIQPSSQADWLFIRRDEKEAINFNCSTGRFEGCNFG